jgi:ornithine cyclodeaminase/alanine dehydrogenase-like protein (mu-crystallin family)
MGPPPDIRYLARADVASLLPPLDEQIELVAETFAAHREGRVDLPPKPGVHPRPDSVIRALPVYLEDQDVAAVKWVGGYAGNRARGLDFMNGVIVLSDADNGLPLAVMDAGEITAARTAAASGLCIRRWARPGWRRASILGCGEQARFHAELLRMLEPQVEIHAYDPHPERIASLGSNTVPHSDPREAVRGSDIVITAGPIRANPTPIVDRQLLGDRYLALPLDFDSMIDGSVVHGAQRFLVDDAGQYRDQRERGRFGSWPAEPDALVGGRDTPADEADLERIVCANLGIGALDAAYADLVLKRAIESGTGIRLPR